MRIAPVSGDLLVKAALVAIGVGVAVWAVRRATSAAGDVAGRAWGAIGDAAYSVAPWNNDNVLYQTVNRNLFPDGQQSLGGWVYDVLHPEPTGWPAPAWPVLSGGGQRNNNPSAYVAPGVIEPDYSGAGVWG